MTLFFTNGIILLVCPVVVLAHTENWIDRQIEQDLQYLVEHPTTTQALSKHFVELQKHSKYVLYGKIRKNQWSWATNIPRRESYKKELMTQFFERLALKYALPDTDIIICLEDGVANFAIPFERHYFGYGRVAARPHLLRGENREPIFAVSKVRQLENVFLLPDWCMMQELIACDSKQEGHASISWDQKKEIAFFRGNASGYLDKTMEGFGNPRIQLLLFSRAHADLVDADVTHLIQTDETPYSDLKIWYRQKIGKVAPLVSKREQHGYKYLLDVDGHSSAFERCRWILLSDSALCKVEGAFEQWYYKALVPWEHYIPIARNLNDLEACLYFLRKHDDVAHAIAEKGKKLGEDIFSLPRVEEYVVRLFWAYSRYIKISNE